MTEAGESSDSRGEMSTVMDYGYRRISCGYCKSSGRTSISYAMWAFDLTVDDYQELIDRGWRRSGCLLYKPKMEKTCCPSYTIRLEAKKFVPSKEQARVMKKMRRFLEGKVGLERANGMQVKMDLQSQKDVSSQSCNLSSGVDVLPSRIQMGKVPHQEDRFICYLAEKINDAVKICIKSQEMPSNIELPKATVKKVKTQLKKKLSDDLAYTSSISFQIAAVLRHSNEPVINTSTDGKHMEFSPTIIADKLALYTHQRGKLSDFSVKACNGHLNFYPSGSFEPVKELVHMEDHSHHSKDRDDSKYEQKCQESSVKGYKAHKIEIRLNRSGFDPEEYALYRKYQIRVHNDKPEKVTESSYERFLVHTPLIFQQAQPSNRVIPSCGFGSFHQQYLIDGRLVAVGVVDILPRCLSSKYLFWDPDFAVLSLGKYSALTEINWVRETEVNCPTLQYYYLGYYIHTSRKMRYKAAYRPSELLCPVKYEWVPFHIAKPLLDKEAYAVLSDFAAIQNLESSLQLPLDSAVNPTSKDSNMGDSVEYLSDEEEEMEIDLDSDSEYSGELDFEIGRASLESENIGDINKVLLDVRGLRLRFQDLEEVFGLSKEQLKSIELRLREFLAVVGDNLGGRLVYRFV